MRHFSAKATVSHEWTPVDLAANTDATAVILTSLGTFQGTNTADLRLRTTGDGTTECFVEDDLLLFESAFIG